MKERFLTREELMVEGGIDAAQTPPINHNERRKQLIIIDLIFDISLSMSLFFSDLIHGFNQLILPGLKKVHEKDAAAIRLGCILFSDEVVKPWYGFLPLDQIEKRSLRITDFEAPGLKGQTALYRAIIEALRGTSAVSDKLRNNNSLPIRKLMIITDGANNEAPFDVSEVRKAVIDFNLGEEDTLAMAYFDTNQGLSLDKFNAMAKAIGVTHKGYFDLTKDGNKQNIEDRRKAFRRALNLFSKESVLK
ncbi:MAG: hypothetical protein UY41_C0019G0007 [Candidatus Moranbacteria bacterium GW2011_GWE1_49_15]|nr:MAG: hypothetical protein UX75_C0018G0005 [Candidatus Moranbacteria bacterium GW2011_GWE2_47_10]KKW06619.1 MAG: hypothetical protein UY41_C0019G0007 [Candidatus Moranbacteria bacterium GW2011_GWE1_49_15]HBP01043.1 hypothetical protein [Candidatus Moranbacteria bacterium]